MDEIHKALGRCLDHFPELMRNDLNDYWCVPDWPIFAHYLNSRHGAAISL
jgi:hypothetical protein